VESGAGWQKQASKSYKMNKIGYESVDDYGNYKYFIDGLYGTHDELNK